MDEELAEIRRLVAERYFGDPDLVTRLKLLVTITEIPPHPRGDVWYPETYAFFAQAQIGGHDWDFINLIHKHKFCVLRHGEVMIDQIWSEMRIAMLKLCDKERGETHAVLSG